MSTFVRSIELHHWHTSGKSQITIEASDPEIIQEIYGYVLKVFEEHQTDPEVKTWPKEQENG